MTQIRLALASDIESSIEGGREFASLAYPDMAYCEASMRKCLTRQVEDGTLIIAERQDRIIGGIGGLVAPFFHNQSILALFENFWWVHREHRGTPTGIRLLMAFEKRAAEIGCHFVYMMALEHMQAEKIDAVYLRLGYQPAERGYRKRL